MIMNYYQPKEIQPKDIITGETYHLVGDIQNGNFVTHEEVTRKITRMDDKFIYCECGRRFFINKNLHVYIPNRRRL